MATLFITRRHHAKPSWMGQVTTLMRQAPDQRKRLVFKDEMLSKLQSSVGRDGDREGFLQVLVFSYHFCKTVLNQKNKYSSI